MRSFIAIAAIFAAVNANGHEADEWNMDHDGMDHGMDHGMDGMDGMDHGDMHHDDHWMNRDDWADMDCMMTGMGCDSAISLGASAAALAATMAILQ